MRDKVPRQFLEMMAERFATLADPTRLAIIYTLKRDGEQNVTSIVAAVESTAANVSKHLRVLREAGTLSRRKEGLQVFYKLDDLIVQKLCELVCESLLEELGPAEGENTC